MFMLFAWSLLLIWLLNCDHPATVTVHTWHVYHDIRSFSTIEHMFAYLPSSSWTFVSNILFSSPFCNYKHNISYVRNTTKICMFQHSNSICTHNLTICFKKYMTRFIFGNKLYKIYIATAVYYLVILFPTLCLVNKESKSFTCYSKYKKKNWKIKYVFVI